MRIKAGIIGTAMFGLTLSAQASSSPYSSMAVAGSAFSNVWSTTPNMALVADNTWICTQQVTSANGDFKFAANGSWTTNWGGDASLFRVPATASAPSVGGNNLKFSSLTTGLYRFTFNDSTKQFLMEWAGPAPLPLATYINMALVGDFNSWTPNANSLLTNSPANTNLWCGTITLESTTTFQFRPNTNADDQWGAPQNATLAIPASNATACGKSPYVLTGFLPGSFLFELNTSNATFAVTQVTTQSYTISSMTVQGNFIGNANPPGNMTQVGDTATWESDHQITTNLIAAGGTATWRFSANIGTNLPLQWGATNGTPAAPLPVAGTLSAAFTNFASGSGITPGRYKITFNHLTGAFSFRQSYSDASGINLFQNPGFEQTTYPDGGDAVGWTTWQAWPKNVSNNGFAPHSGNWCGSIEGKWYPERTDYGSFSQNVPVTSGKTYNASAWFKATTNWSASSMQLKIEWYDSTNGPAGSDVVADIAALTTNWVKYSVEGTAPTAAAIAHVVFLCSGATTNFGSSMHIDDAEMRTVASRSQNFDTWGSLSSFGAFAPDWSITSGKTIWNVAPGRPPADVFISQYVEGTGNNKAIEIYNGTLSNLDLAADNYVLQQFDNGSTSATVTLALSGVLTPGAALVVGRPVSNFPPDTAISGLANLLTNKYLTFNGDDVVVLKKGGATGTVKDRVGQVGTNATGSTWSRNTKNHTLTRNSTIFTGTVNAVTSAFPLLDEWTISSNDTFNGLGIHDISYLDPNQPYTPAGYSLLMNTNAILMSGELSGGIGDISFWYRTESMSPAVTMVIETAAAEEGPWTTNATLAGLAASNFAYYVVAINRSDATYLRLRQTDGGTNRFRVDEIVISELSSTRRTEDFSGWTDPSYDIPGNYSRYGWSIQSASITTNGAISTRAALLGATNSYVLSPAFEGGLGETRFWAKAADSGTTAYLLLQTSTNAGSNWTTQASFTVTTGQTFSAWLYQIDPNAQARITSDSSQPFSDVIVDSIEIRLPALYRNQNFDGWPPRSTYTNDSYQGWSILNSIVDSQNAYDGQVARLNTPVGNYIQSPYLPDGLGTISFQTRRWAASDAAFTLQVQVSSNGTTWTTLANVSASATNYETFTYFLWDTTNHYVRLYHSAGVVRVLVDDIRIGLPQPRPEVLAVPGLDPAPVINEAATLTADVVTRYGASILSVTGYYRINNGSTNLLAMTMPSLGAWESTTDIAGQTGGTVIRYFVKIWYAGVGADTNSTAYSTNVYTSAVYTNYVSTVEKGDVWINEISYTSYGPYEPWILLDEDPWFMWTGQNHEFVEICGRAGADVSGWTLQLALGADMDIATNGNQAVYATYRFPTNTVFTNQTNGFSFYVVGDADLATNRPVNQILTTLVPLAVNPYAVEYKDNIYDGVGVIRLVDQYSNLVYALSYVGYATGADHIPQTQTPGGTNSIGLAGTGGNFGDFSWDLADLTVGTINGGQILSGDIVTNVYASAWHLQLTHVVPVNTNFVPPFYMLDPLHAANWDTLGIYYGYTNSAYTSPTGTLYHRRSGIGASWTLASMGIREGSLDASGYGYVYAQIAPRTYHRLQTMEYVIAVYPNQSGVLPVFLGSGPGSNNVNTIYTNFSEAAASPFSYQFPISDVIVITNFILGTTNAIIQTEGNDFYEPVTNYYVRFTTNLLVSTNDWLTTNFVHTLNSQSQSMFNVRRSTSVWPKAFYRVDPRGP